MTQVSKTFNISEIAKNSIDPVNSHNMFTFKKQEDILNVGLTKTISYAIAFYKADPYLNIYIFIIVFSYILIWAMEIQRHPHPQPLSQKERGDVWWSIGDDVFDCCE